MLLHLLPTMETSIIMQNQNHIPKPNRQNLDFLHPIFIVQEHTEHL